MARRVTLNLSLLAATALPACGTISSAFVGMDDRSYEVGGLFPGVRYDLDKAKERIANADSPPQYVFTVAYCLIDMPLCAVCDTLSLPWALAVDRASRDQTWRQFCEQHTVPAIRTGSQSNSHPE
jgi:uncharacterized protein YceK